MRKTLLLAAVIHVGCATFQPALGDTCRDSLGRFATCTASPGGDDATTAVIVLGVLAGVAGAAALIGYAVRSSSAQPTPEPAATSAASSDLSSCGIYVSAVQVCRSPRGYLLAWPTVGSCPNLAEPVRVIPLTCGDVERPACHACVDGRGGWQAVRSWETCDSAGMLDARGDFLPPGRDASDGLGPVGVSSR